MILFFITFCISAIINLVVLRFSADWISWIGDHTTGVQKIHDQPTPRIGGVSIYGALLSTALLAWLLDWGGEPSLALWMCLCGLPLFIVGLTEDITKMVGVKTRLAFAFVAGLLAFYLVGAQITRLDIPFIDSLLGLSIVSALFSAFAIAGLSNAYNIIDGLNGLASMVAIIALGALAIVSTAVGDEVLLTSALTLMGAVVGFFFFNYPQGRIFLGDGGAYFIGFWLALLSILLVARNPSVSPWFALLLNAYPIIETLFSVWRRKVHQNRNPGLPDAAHFHSLVYRRLMMWSKRYLRHGQSHDAHYLTNARTSPYLWALSSMGVLPALLWWDSTPTLMLSALAFIALYLFLYYRITRKVKRVWS
jgi:UDP-N-acetylmuramyl pentapeptide phosphotransferase/UDP-N-acetylglucosamine-1-phosphate transferase